MKCINPPDDALLSLIVEGNEQGLNTIFDRYWTRLVLYAIKLTHDPEASKDIVQNIFISLWQRADKIKIKLTLSSFLYGSVRNAVLMLERNKSYLDRYKGSLDAESYHPSPEISFLEKELITFYDDAILKLPPKMREVFILSRKEEMSYKEICTRLNIAMPTVKNQITSAMRILRIKATNV